MLINKKDIIGINQEIGEKGNLRNEGTLDFTISTIKQKKSWLQELCYLLRSLLTDHAFEDGNKRTALIILILYFKDQNLDYDKDKLIKTIWEISKKNIADINKLMRMVKNAINT